MELSIIVPVYNVEKYLKECLDSLLDQDIKDYEIIVVNDGSTDLSQPIIDSYVAKYPNVHSLIKPNGGLASARNLGIKHASGKYITFVDSDDKIKKDAYKDILDKMDKEGLDICIFDMLYWFDDDRDYIQKGLIRNNEDIIKDLLLSPLSSCNKVYRRELFDGICFPEGKLFEDIPTVISVYLKKLKVGYIDKPYYIYRQRNTSIMNTAYTDKANDIFEIMKMTLDNIDDQDKDKYHDELEYLFIEQLVLYGAYRFLAYDKPYHKEMMDKALKLIKRYYPKYKKNRYIKGLSTKEKIFLHLNFKITYPIWHMYLRRK